jgi:hypothetical protein
MTAEHRVALRAILCELDVQFGHYDGLVVSYAPEIARAMRSIREALVDIERYEVRTSDDTSQTQVDGDGA